MLSTFQNWDEDDEDDEEDDDATNKTNEITEEITVVEHENDGEVLNRDREDGDGEDGDGENGDGVNGDGENGDGEDEGGEDQEEGEEKDGAEGDREDENEDGNDQDWIVPVLRRMMPVSLDAVRKAILSKEAYSFLVNTLLKVMMQIFSSLFKRAVGAAEHAAVEERSDEAPLKDRTGARKKQQ